MRTEPKGQRRAGSVWTVVGAFLLLSSCGAQVKEFSAAPRHVCAGQRVEITWSVVGAAEMTVTPAVPGAPSGRIPGSGRASISPVQPTRVVLHVTRTLGSPTESKQDIEVVTSAENPEPLAASLGDPAAGATCDNGQISATIHARNFAADVKVDKVVSHTGDGRAYDIEHGGHKGRVAPPTPALDFAGLPIAGDWKLTSPLQAGEACGTPTLPRNLTIDVYTQCTPGGTP